MEYAVIIEKGETSYGASVPDLPGCVAVAGTRDEVLALIREAIELHLDGMQRSGEQLPTPCCDVEMISIDAPSRVARG